MGHVPQLFFTCNPSIMVKPSFCKTITFQASYFHRIIRLWNLICTIAPFSCLSSVSAFKSPSIFLDMSGILEASNIRLDMRWACVENSNEVRCKSRVTSNPKSTKRKKKTVWIFSNNSGKHTTTKDHFLLLNSYFIFY